ncbi:extracellular solute-binding protein [Engelhardtia mirabilis]|uniref:Iron-utilization periplasmic protein n=1 Tax=Engelhardtia mirabilis TaxID=2528011 RepID=A0A518BLP1_9BACT|nr:Iron-utilization periplasmic protein precursor [Planctomycetes bacterium Pla133]QDV02217.1 Iron-utilization periplasmic protein precursor [Planctomycetes bacterium Pla86]
MRPQTTPQWLTRAAALAFLTLISGCGAGDYDLTVYSAADQIHAEPLLQRFEEETGLRVNMVFDVEANKTVGLVARLRKEAEQGTVRCDVFWNNEIANTVALAADGLLQPYDSPAAADIPATFKDPGHLWTGFAARGRVLIVNTERLGDRAAPSSLDDLLSPAWSGEAGIARPLSGTTLTHAAVLYDVLGDDAARAFWKSVKQRNAAGALNLASGNGPLMRSVGTGEYTWGWTDTDDFNVARVRGMPVLRVAPDQVEGGMGLLMIPNTAAIVAGAPNLDNAKRFYDWLVSADTEAALASSDSANVPVRPNLVRPENVLGTSELHVMEVDWQQVGQRLPAIQTELKELFLD